MGRVRLLCFLLLLIVQCLSLSIVSANLKDGYALEKVVVYSRHNMRAPLNITPDSLLYKVTPHTWFTWSDKSGELTSKGGELETLMGQYFRKWLEAEKLIPENYVPQKDETRFYANSAQRTIATAKYFSAGMLPIANVEVERHLALNRMDDVFVFNPGTFPLTAEFQRQVQMDINKMGGTVRLGENVTDGVALVEKILDFKNSIYAKENNLKTFHKKNEPDFTVKVNGKLNLGGAIRPAMTAADALILQYYEGAGVFNHKVTFEEWQKIGRLQSLGLYTIFRMPSISKPAVKLMRKTIREELLHPKRKFTFLCGHDIGIIGTLSALEVEDYELPDSIEPLTPIGVKLVIEKRRGKDDKEYAALKLMYLSSEQIINKEILYKKNPPRIVSLKLKGLKANKDGLYSFDDVIKRLS